MVEKEVIGRLYVYRKGSFLCIRHKSLEAETGHVPIVGGECSDESSNQHVVRRMDESRTHARSVTYLCAL